MKLILNLEFVLNTFLMNNSITALTYIPIIGIILCSCFVIFQIIWMVQMRRIAKANTEYTLMQIRLFNEFLKNKSIEADLQKINEETASQINDGKDFRGWPDKGYKL